MIRFSLLSPTGLRRVGWISITVALMTGFLCAQSWGQGVEASRPVMFRLLVQDVRIGGLRYELKGGERPVQTPYRQLSPQYECPENGRLSIYRLAPSTEPGKPPRRVTVAETFLKGEGPFLVVLSGNNPGGPAGLMGVQTLDDSWQAHPEHAVRVLNFSQRHVAIQLGRSTAELSPAQSYVSLPQAAAGTIEFKVATSEHGVWTLRIQSPRTLIRRTRVTLLLTDAPPAEDDPAPVALNVTSLIDTSQPPPAKASP